jgi:putative ABC transport system permease protein
MISEIRRFLFRLLNLFRPGQSETEAERELGSHLNLLEDEFARRGMSDEEARLAAKRAFGSIELARENHRDERSLPRIEDFQRDLRYAVRSFGRNPGFGATVVFTLALGIGSATAVFSVVNAVVLKPLPYPASERIVTIAPLSQGKQISVTPGDFLDWQTQARSFSDITAFTVVPYNLTGSGDPAAVRVACVTERFVETLGIPPMLGHTFSTAGSAGVGPSVLISNRIWQQRFQADARIVGTSLSLEGKPYTIIGVMPEGYSFPQDLLSPSRTAQTSGGIDVWTVLVPRPGDRSNAFLRVVGRLKPDVTLGAAQAEMSSLAGALAQQPPLPEGGPGVAVSRLQERISQPVRPLLITLFGAVALLLLVACVNVANLMLARSTSREREMAIRRALGSGRGRLLQQQMTESLLLVLLGGLIGLVFASWSLTVVSRIIPAGSLPRSSEIQMDWRVLLFTAAVSLFAAVFFSVLPALQSRPDRNVSAGLKLSTSTLKRGMSFLRFLVCAEVALAFVLLTGALLLFESLQRLTSVDSGFQPQSVLTASINLPEGRYRGLAEMRSFWASVLNGLKDRTPVQAAGAVNLLPIGGPSLNGDFVLEGIERPRGFVASKPSVSPGYFGAMRIPLIQGRDFNDEDREDAPKVAIVSAQFASRAWPGIPAVGKRLKLGFGPAEKQPWLTVVGVVGDVKDQTLADESRPAIYTPFEQAPLSFLLRSLTFAVRTDGDARAMETLLREQIRRVDPDLPIERMTTMEQLLSDSVSEPRFRAGLLAVFGLSAMALIAVGVFGVLGYWVAARTREIGVRVAVGARRADVGGMVVREAIKMTVTGISFGSVLAFAVTRGLQQFLFSISPHDPRTFIVAGGVLVAMSLAASYIPARRAADVDPLIALRTD